MKVKCRLFEDDVYQPGEDGENETLVNFLKRLKGEEFISATAVAAPPGSGLMRFLYIFYKARD